MAVAMECAVFASPDGEGRHRFTPNTAAFTDTSRRCRRIGVQPNDPKEDEYTAKVGPGSYLSHDKAGDARTASDWGRAILPRDAETLAAQTAIQPHIAFELEREDKRGWNWDPVEGHMVKPKLSFNKARRYNNACMPKPETAPCATDYYDAARGHRALEAKPSSAHDRGAASSFTSKADRWRARAGEAPDGADGPGSGPGMYGVPHDPMSDSFSSLEHRAHRKRDPNTGAADKRLSTFRVHTHTRRRAKEFGSDDGDDDPDADLRGGDKDPHRSPGMYWSKSMQDLHALRPSSAESVRGTSGFAASGRKDTKLQKDIAKWRRNMPTAHFDLRRESRCWSASGSARRLGSAGAVVTPAPSCLLTGAGTRERFPMSKGPQEQVRCLLLSPCLCLSCCSCLFQYLALFTRTSSCSARQALRALRLPGIAVGLAAATAPADPRD